MNKINASVISRRKFFLAPTVYAVATGVGLGTLSDLSAADEKDRTKSSKSDMSVGEILGQGDFVYRANRHWGLLDRNKYPVKDCHGVAEDQDGRIVVLTNDTHNNLIAYGKGGQFLAAWEDRFPAAHGFEVTLNRGEDRYWIVDHERQVVSMCTPDGRELRRLDPGALKSKYADLTKYHPTNVAILPDGDFFVSDGYGSSYVHHFDPDWRYMSSFGGEGDGPENLKQPHAVWIDRRSGKPLLLICDRGNEQLKWFSLRGELLRTVSLPGALPSNIAPFNGHFSGHLAVACLNGMILIMDGADRVVSAVGGETPVYSEGELQPLSSFNYTFNHPHDVHVDESGALYVVQWWSNQTYPIKLEPLSEMT